MFGFALLASCSPCHDDWLNEWSSTPPVSRTMHALIAPPAAGAELAGAAGVDAAGAELAGAAALVVAGAGALLAAGLALFLLEQPARMIATVPVAAMI